MTKRQPLEALLRDFEAAPPADRISHREAILAHGKPAIEALRSLVQRRPDLGASIASWLEAYARRTDGDRAAAVAALRRLSINNDEAKPYATGALARLGVGAARETASPKTSGLPPSAGTDWPGFQEHEFGQNAGTHWRSRTPRQHPASPAVDRRLRSLACPGGSWPFDPGLPQSRHNSPYRKSC